MGIFCKCEPDSSYTNLLLRRLEDEINQMRKEIKEIESNRVMQARANHSPNTATGWFGKDIIPNYNQHIIAVVGGKHWNNEEMDPKYVLGRYCCQGKWLEILEKSHLPMAHIVAWRYVEEWKDNELD